MAPRYLTPMTGDGTVASPFGVNKTDMFVQSPLFTGTSGEGSATSAYIGFSGYNETVLWSAADSIHSTNTFTLSEPLSSFTNVRFEGFEYGNTRVQYDCPAPTALTENVSICYTYYCRDTDNNPFQIKMASYSSNDGLTYGGIQHKFLYMDNTSTAFNTNAGDWLSMTKIVGINRKPEA